MAPFQNQTSLPDDAQLIGLYWARDEKAIEYTDRKYRRYLFTVAHNIVLDRLDCEECLNATCLLAALLLLPDLLSGCNQESDTVTAYCVSSITTAGSNNLFAYDERGNLLEEYYESERSEYTRVRTYDEDGNLLTDVSYDAKGQQNTALLSYAYDERGNLLKKEQTDLEGNVTTNSYTYDENGNLYQVDYQGRPMAELEHIRLEVPREALEKVQEQQRSLLESYTPEKFKELYG